MDKSEEKELKPLIVGIGSSAGGVEAMIDFFEALPPDTGLSYIIARHIGYGVNSQLDEILARHAKMPVIEVTDTMEMENNEIYIASSKCNIEVTDDHLRPVVRPRFQSLNFSVDELFHTLGRAVGDRAVAIILSGAGTDGSRGLKTIKESGGKVLVQTPESARFNGMPHSALRTNLADYVFPPAILAEVVQELARSHRRDYLLIDPNEENFDKQYQNIIAELSKKGIDLTKYDQSHVSRHVEYQMFINRCKEVNEFVKAIRENPSKADLFFQDFLIGMPRFFQDKAAFESLAIHAIPKMADNLPLRLWTVGCATGEEAISLALLLEAQLQSSGMLDYRIFASDVNAHATKKASLTTFPIHVSQDIPRSFLQRYFIKQDSNFKLKHNVTDKILFMVHNALSDAALLRMDLISCRYLLPYLKPRIRTELLEKLTDSLKPGGFLFLSPEDSIDPVRSAYMTIDEVWKIFRKKE